MFCDLRGIVSVIEFLSGRGSERIFIFGASRHALPCCRRFFLSSRIRGYPAETVEQETMNCVLKRKKSGNFKVPDIFRIFRMSLSVARLFVLGLGSLVVKFLFLKLGEGTGF